jgi:hypothetical protein
LRAIVWHADLFGGVRSGGVVLEFCVVVIIIGFVIAMIVLDIVGEDDGFGL